jgi:FimV-like protein
MRIARWRRQQHLKIIREEYILVFALEGNILHTRNHCILRLLFSMVFCLLWPFIEGAVALEQDKLPSKIAGVPFSAETTVILSTSVAILLLIIASIALFVTSRGKSRDKQPAVSGDMEFSNEEMYLRLQLAQHYLEVTDPNSASQILQEVVLRGNETEKKLAMNLLLCV